jgi:hypothetical protein
MDVYAALEANPFLCAWGDTRKLTTAAARVKRKVNQGKIARIFTVHGLLYGFYKRGRKMEPQHTSYYAHNINEL